MDEEKQEKQEKNSSWEDANKMDNMNSDCMDPKSLTGKECPKDVKHDTSTPFPEP